MRLTSRTAVVLAGAGSVAMLAAVVAQSQSTTAGGPVRYAMDAATMSGMSAMGAGGGGGFGAMMGMMSGRAPEAVRTLDLHHGAPTTAPKPQADHFMPKAAGMGTSLRLTPLTREPGEPGMPGEMQMPKGRLLLFWGCGERAPKGQPVVIDFAKLARGQIPPGLFMSGVDLPEDWQVTIANSRTYTRWPNDKDRKTVPASGSLLGAHRITANYSKEIGFNLAEDFMPPLDARTTAAPGGGSKLAWGGLDKATGYYAWAIGAKDMGRGDAPSEMVWWASSKQQAFGGPLWDWISPAGVRKLVANGTVMPPAQRDCTVPAEVIKAAGEGLMVSLQAYGPQADFAYPPRPADSKKPWNPEWIARVRFRSSTMLIPGMADAMGGAAGQGASDTGQDSRPAKRKCKGLRGIAERAAGLCE
jgi:hypothetical protein